MVQNLFQLWIETLSAQNQSVSEVQSQYDLITQRHRQS